MSKYIIREIKPESRDFTLCFDNAELSAADDYCDTLFILHYNRFGRYEGFNAEEFENICNAASEMQEMFLDIEEGCFKSFYPNYKECMIHNGMPYTPRKCHRLKELLRDWDNTPENVAKWLTITTGEAWETSSAYGYCQGDYVETIFCSNRHQNDAQIFGEIWLGAAKEFCVITLDESGEEIDTCYGYVVADCEAQSDEGYKRIVSKMAGIAKEHTQIEMIDGYTRTYSYRTA